MSNERSYEELMLGDALTRILEDQWEHLPMISEYQFQREVLDILENPFGIEALRRYGVYVGELTKPLQVVSNDERREVLFMVPALVQSPQTTIITGKGGMTAEMFFATLNRDADLGGRHINRKIANFMTAITKTPNYYQEVIVPIQQILARYQRSMVPLPGVTTDTPARSTGPNAASASESSFSDDYDD